VSWLAEKGRQPEFGARPLRRAIQREVDNPMSRLLLDGRLHRGQRVRVVVREGHLDFEVVETKEPVTVGQTDPGV
jgi:ATP-dependent Clp protease ATP-binding subunit ClpC